MIISGQVEVLKRFGSEPQMVGDARPGRVLRRDGAARTPSPQRHDEGADAAGPAGAPGVGLLGAGRQPRRVPRRVRADRARARPSPTRRAPRRIPRPEGRHPSPPASLQSAAKAATLLLTSERAEENEMTTATDHALHVHEKIYIGGEWVQPAGTGVARGDQRHHRAGHGLRSRGDRRGRRQGGRRRVLGLRELVADLRARSAPTGCSASPRRSARGWRRSRR